MLEMGTIANQIDDREAWKALFESFLSSVAQKSEKFDIEVDAHSVWLVSSCQVCLSIYTAVSNSKSARECMRYTLSEVFDLSERKQVESTIPEINFNNANATTILKRIFSKKLLSTCGLTKVNLANDNPQSKILRIPIEIYGFDVLAEAQLKILSAAMIGAGLHGMKKAFLGQGPLLEINEKIQESMLELAPEFQKAFFVEENNEGKKLAFVINYGILLNLLFPKVPELRLEPTADSKYTLSFDKKALLAYLVDTFDEGFRLRVQGDRATPICLPKSNLAKAKILLSLVLDRSGSMENDLPNLVLHVKSFLQDYIAQSAPGDIIRLVDFADDMTEQEYLLTGNSEQDLSKIYAHLNLLTADGYTSLYNTLQSEITTLSSDKYHGYTESVIIFTDGLNETKIYKRSEEPERARQEDEEFLNNYQLTMEQLQAQNPSQVLSVFSLGLGEYYNKQMLKQWAKLSGVHHTHLKTSDDFAMIKAHLEKIRRPRMLVNFVQREMKHRFSVYEGSLGFEPDFTLAANEPFTYNDRSFQFVSTALQPAQEMDVIAELSSEGSDEVPFSELVSDRTYTPSKIASKQSKEETVDAYGVTMLSERFERLWSTFKKCR